MYLHLEIFLTLEGMTMIAVQLAMGVVLGFLLFVLTVLSLPTRCTRTWMSSLR